VVDPPPQLRVAGGELGAGVDEARLQGPYDLAHREVLVDTGVVGARHAAARRVLRDEMDAPGLDEPHDQALGAEQLKASGVLERVDDILHGSGVRQRGRGGLPHISPLTRSQSNPPMRFKARVRREGAGQSSGTSTAGSTVPP
jgi:hypothetical protein